VPVLGVVENMSGPFGRGAGRTVATELQVPFLGEVPFDETIVTEGDLGTPTIFTRPESVSGLAFDAIANAVATALGWQHVGSAVGARDA
jgi:ATP-binding protein involved in chromosome partitioning